MLEEVLAYWKKWTADSKDLEAWLEMAYRKLDVPEEEKMEFFQVRFSHLIRN